MSSETQDAHEATEPDASDLAQDLEITDADTADAVRGGQTVHGVDDPQSGLPTG